MSPPSMDLNFVVARTLLSVVRRDATAPRSRLLTCDRSNIQEVPKSNMDREAPTRVAVMRMSVQKNERFLDRQP